jgi:hypothetical protein
MDVLRVVLWVNVWFQLPSSAPLFLKIVDDQSLKAYWSVLRTKAGGMAIEGTRDEEEGDVFYVTIVMMMIIGIPSKEFSLLASEVNSDMHLHLTFRKAPRVSDTKGA